MIAQQGKLSTIFCVCGAKNCQRKHLIIEQNGYSLIF